MSTIIVIPARYASTRLPAKALLRETGKYLVQHVYESAKLSKLATEVIIATDDARIYDAVCSFGGKAEMTSDKHQSGTDRMAEVAAKISGDIFINVQGDEPEIRANAIDSIIRTMQENPDIPVGTLAYPLDANHVNNPNIVKVVCDHHHMALYFSRSPIPYHRDTTSSAPSYLGHVGLYAYRRSFLLEYPNLAPSPLEKAEKLEQLRVLENGYRMSVKITDYCAKGIDTPEDYQAFVARYSKKCRLQDEIF